MGTKLAIVGIFFDGYYDLWEDFLELFQEHWGDCPYPLYIVNNEIDLLFDKEYNVSVLHAGKKAEYSRKVQYAIQSIDADYFLLLLEDFFIEERLKRNVLENIIKIMEKENYKYYRLQMPEFFGNGRKKSLCDKKYSFLTRIAPTEEYTLTCQPSIWEKSFLKQCIGKENYNAWVFEGIYCYSKKAHSKEFLEKCRIDYRNPLKLRHGAVQGKLLPSVYKDFVSSGYTFKTERDVFSGKAYKKYLRKRKLKQIIPLHIQKLIKRVMRTDSVIERYKEEIIYIMKKMRIE